MVADGEPVHGPRLVRGSVSENSRQAIRRAGKFCTLVRSEQAAQQNARNRARQSTSRREPQYQSRLHVRSAARCRRCLQAGSLSDPKALADAVRSTNITNNVSPGPGIQFNKKGQNDKLKNSAIQNRGGKLMTVAPKVAANAKVEWPLKPYGKRG